MDVSFLKLKINTVVAYSLENGKHLEGEAFDEFIPIVNEFSIPDTTALEFKNIHDVNLSINEYDRSSNGRNLAEKVIKNKKIDVTHNDVNVGTTTIVLNFTDTPITCYNSLNLPTILYPLQTTKLKDRWHGKIIIIQIHRLMSPASYNFFAGATHDEEVRKVSYLIDILNKNKYVPTDESQRMPSREGYSLKIIDFAQKFWDSIDYFDPDFKASTIKVVTSSILPDESFRTETTFTDGKYCRIFIPNLQLYFIKGCVVGNERTPALNQDEEYHIFKKFIIPGTKFLYIVDKQNKIGDRYYNIGGQVEKVVRCNKFKHHDDGLFLAHFDEDYSLIKTAKIDLDKIDEVPSIYKTQEEARIGADKTKQYEDELRLRKNELEADLLNLKAKYTRELQENEKRFLQFKHELETNSLREKYNYEQYNNRMKNYFDERKYVRDDIRYERDSFLETLKTVASVCGVLASGYLVVTKLAGSK